VVHVVVNTSLIVSGTVVHAVVNTSLVVSGTVLHAVVSKSLVVSVTMSVASLVVTSYCVGNHKDEGCPPMSTSYQKSKSWNHQSEWCAL
jgi:hypothetical protein